MKKLDNRFDKKELLKKQFNEWKKENFNYSSHYLSNIVQLTFGYESKNLFVSPKDFLVHSSFNKDTHELSFQKY